MDPVWAYRSPGFRALNLRFGVRSTEPDVGAYLDHVLSGLRSGDTVPEIWYSISRSAEGTGCVYPLYFGSELVVRAHSRAFAVETLLWHLNGATVERADRLVILHAAGVVGEGGGIIICGPSGSGKTTLTAALIRSGFRYLTDEALAIDPTNGLLLPYPKPLGIKRGSWELLPDLRPPRSDLAREVWHVVPTDIRADAIAEASRPALVLFPTRRGRDRSKRRADVTEMSRAEGLVALFQQCFGSDHAPHALRTLANVLTGCACFAIATDDMDRTVRRVAEMSRPARMAAAATATAAPAGPAASDSDGDREVLRALTRRC